MIKRELILFLLVGTLAVLIDFVIYRSLVGLEVMRVDMAKASGFFTGSLFAYVANRFYTFGHALHAPGHAWRFVVLYGATLCVNILINSFVLNLFVNKYAAVSLAFLFATGFSTTLNFLGMKFFVFKAYTGSRFI